MAMAALDHDPDQREGGAFGIVELIFEEKTLARSCRE
jgi:hypothetical protein